MRILLGNKEFEVRVSESPEESRIGLSQTEVLPKGEGFAMKFDGKSVVPITMKEMSFPLDIIFTFAGKVTSIVTAKPGSKDVLTSKPSDLIIEVNAGEAKGISKGDEVSFVGKKNEDGTVEMAEGGITPVGQRHVLDENGQNQMNLKGGERIFSRISTKKIFELAKTKDYSKLGKYVMAEVTAQDKRPTEYAAN